MKTWKEKVNVKKFGICTVKEATDREANGKIAPISHGFVNLYHGNKWVGFCGVNHAEEHKVQGFTADDLWQDASTAYIDFGCNIYDKINENTILFDGDKEDNGGPPRLYLKFYKDYARFTGTQLTPQEKQKKYMYKKYHNIEAFTNDLLDFTVPYFKSFVLSRKL